MIKKMARKVSSKKEKRCPMFVMIRVIVITLLNKRVERRIFNMIVTRYYKFSYHY